MKSIVQLVVCCMLFMNALCFAKDNKLPSNAPEPIQNAAAAVELSPIESIRSLYSTQADWTFMGAVSNENNERYHYFFQIQRDFNRFHAVATIINSQTNTVVLYEDSYTLIEQPELAHWQIGNLFLRFNPISNNWVFGVKSKKKKGFNFKVDTLGASGVAASKPQELRTGIDFLITQTGRLNGHLQIDDKEQFVTAKKAWFRQLWVTKPQTEKHVITAVLCDLNNGTAFYSANIPESDSLRGSIAGWRDELGNPVTMSQFVNFEKKDDHVWELKLSSPKMKLAMQDLLFKLNENEQLAAGTVTGTTAGFCTISHREIDKSLEESR